MTMVRNADNEEMALVFQGLLAGIVEIVLNDHDTDIIGLSEMRLDETISDPEVSISGYNIFRNDHDVKRKLMSRQVYLNQQ